jgi:hypothetical protein
MCEQILKQEKELDPAYFHITYYEFVSLLIFPRLNQLPTLQTLRTSQNMC